MATEEKITSRRETARAYRYRNPKLCRWRVFESSLRRKYGIDSEDWARMYEGQGGKCLGCEAQLRLDATTTVDHDHSTGLVRGLLCLACNGALGLVLDRTNTLLRLVAYLEATATPLFHSDARVDDEAFEAAVYAEAAA